MGACGFGAQVAPILDPSVSTPDPGQRDQVDLLVHAHRIDHGDEFFHDWIVFMIFKHGQICIVRRIGCIVRIGDDVFDVKLTRLGDNETQLLGGDRQFGKIVLRHLALATLVSTCRALADPARLLRGGDAYRDQRHVGRVGLNAAGDVAFTDKRRGIARRPAIGADQSFVAAA